MDYYSGWTNLITQKIVMFVQKKGFIYVRMDQGKKL